MAEERKAVVTFKGTPLTLVGPEIKPGQPAPDVTAVDTSLQAGRLSDAKGKVPILSSVPTLHTPVSDAQKRPIDQTAATRGPAGGTTATRLARPCDQTGWT